MIVRRFEFILGFLAPVMIVAATAAADDSAPATRKFRFTYAATIDGLTLGAKARVWAPVAPTNDDQTVEIDSIEVPGKYRRETEPKFGNELLYFEGRADRAGKIALSVEYRVTRRA